MRRAYYEQATGKILKVLDQDGNTTIEQDIQNNPELNGYTPNQLGFFPVPDILSTDYLSSFRINTFTNKLELTFDALQGSLRGPQGEPGIPGPPGERGLPGEPGKDAQLPFKMWVGTGQTNSSGVATITIPTGTFTSIQGVFPVAEANVSKAEEVPRASLKTYSLTNIQVNVTKYKMLSGLLGLTPTGDFVGAGIKVNVLVIGD